MWIVYALKKSRLAEIEIPLHPFLGCVGTAPERGEVRTTMVPSRHGGNMDCPQVRAGATVYLPVFEPGGLLFLGDCHAAQGDGELCGVALEVSCRVRFSVDVVRGWTIGWPRVEDEEHIMAIGSARIGNVVDPNYSVVARFPKKHLA